MGADSISPVRGRYLIFQLADRTYAVPIRCVEEIVPIAELSSVPGAPSFLAGLLDIGGQLVAVISLRRLLGMPDHECELYTPLVILKAKAQKIALEIDGVSRIAGIDDENLVPLAEGCSLNDCASAVARLDGQVVVVLSPERILLEQEQKRVAELTELARQRLAEIEAVTA
ncbi:MAG: chemotaxis protein CheW [Pirellulales bacterium]